MSLPLSEIRVRATSFAHEWRHTESEDADAKSFLDAFFDVFGVHRRKVASFEKRVKRLDGRDGYIDLLWKGTLLIEQKSRGKRLDRAHAQARDYFPGLSDDELPRYVLVCDFATFELHDVERDRLHRFTLRELPGKVHLFQFISGYRKQEVREDDPINRRAVDALGSLHDALRVDGYTGHPLELFLVRLLFCLFADDTGIFQPKDVFHDLIEFHTRADGNDVGAILDQLFVVLNREHAQRQRALPEHLARFPYVNGKLFDERTDPPAFTAAMRTQLLKLCRMNWGAISPAIFGAMFQKVLELDAKARRRELGAHYTSEANILRLIGPLFLDALRAEFDAVRRDKTKLFELHKKLERLTFLDPACGCGNFLVVAYRELRRLELDVLQAAAAFGERIGAVFGQLKIEVDQFYGIEIEEFPAQVAQVAMWLTDHQMNIEAGEAFGEAILRIPLRKSAQVRQGDALQIDWAELVPPQRLAYIFGNPPFIGKQHQREAQKKGLSTVAHGMPGAGVLDYVAGWYLKAGKYLTTVPNSFGDIATKAAAGRRQHKDMRFGKSAAALDHGDLFMQVDEAETRARRAVRCAFVSTNSITQGEQVGVLWRWMLDQGLHIQFAHRTFKWTNDAPGKAAVHCVIVGFGCEAMARRRLFDYAVVDGPSLETVVSRINPYLVDAPEVVLRPRREPLSSAPNIAFGSMPNDGGHLLLDDFAKRALIAAEPLAEAWIKPFLGADEFINDVPRWCFWLKGCPPQTLRASPGITRRVAAVRATREASKRPATSKLAEFPSLFGEDRQPTQDYLAIPKTSSERRRIVPVRFLSATVIASSEIFTVANATLFHFGILTSTMHNAWTRYTCGRLKSDFRYSASIVYNNFPWPIEPSGKHRAELEAGAQQVLEARASHAGASLAALYDPNTMPANLAQAHRLLDRAVDAAYLVNLPSTITKRPKLGTDGERVAFLFELYSHLDTMFGDGL